MVVQEVGVLAWQGFVGMPGGALVGVPKVKGQEKDLEVRPGGKDLVVNVGVKALGVLAFQVVSEMEESWRWAGRKAGRWVRSL